MASDPNSRLQYCEKFMEDLRYAVAAGDNYQEQGRYPYVPACSQSVAAASRATSAILKHLHPRKKNKFTFLDAGCGIGDKLLIAKRLGFDAYGVELCKKSITIARMLLDEEHVIEENLLEYTKYDRYDVIYLYLPMCDGALQTKLEKRIAEFAKDDVIIISAGDRGFSDKFPILSQQSFYSRMCKKLKVDQFLGQCRIYAGSKVINRLTKDFAECPCCKQ